MGVCWVGFLSLFLLFGCCAFCNLFGGRRVPVCACRYGLPVNFQAMLLKVRVIWTILHKEEGRECERCCPTPRVGLSFPHVRC